MALACGILLALVALPHGEDHPPRLNRALMTPSLVWLGTVSYSLFLWHVPIVWFLRMHGLSRSGASGFAINLVVVGALSVAAAAVTYRFIELPALQRKTLVDSRSEDANTVGSVARTERPNRDPWPSRI
jgi:peptidoglycan/LPS O-acetylase OafA/YrhL